MDYREKYIKYKKKYLEYKKKLQGGDTLYNFKNISYNDCNKNDDSIICDEVKYYLNDTEYKEKNIKWGNIEKKNIFGTEKKIIEGYYNDDSDIKIWTNEDNDPEITKNKIFYDKREIYLRNDNTKNYKNCHHSSFKSFCELGIIKKEILLYNIADKMIKEKNSDDKKLYNDAKINGFKEPVIYNKQWYLDKKYSDDIIKIKNLLIEITMDTRIKDKYIHDLFEDFFIRYLDRYNIDLLNINKSKDTEEIIYYIDGFIIYACCFDTNTKKIISYYNNISCGINNLYGDWDHQNMIWSLIVKYTIEIFELSEIDTNGRPSASADSPEFDNNLKLILNKNIVIHNNNLLFLIKEYNSKEKKWSPIGNKKNYHYNYTPEKLKFLKEFLNFNDVNINKTSKEYVIIDEENKKEKIQRNNNNRFYGYFLYINTKNEFTNYFDFNNLKILKNGKWECANDPQIWAYTDFIINIDNKYKDVKYKNGVKYHSKYITKPDVNSVQLDVYGIDENTQFTIKYGYYNNILYIDKEEEFIICDNERVRRCNKMIYNFQKSDKTPLLINNIEIPKKENRVPLNKKEWFENFFKFEEFSSISHAHYKPEIRYTVNQQSISKIYDKEKNIINGLNCGIFEIFSLEELHQLLDISIKNVNNNKVSIKNEYCSIIDIQNNPKYENSTVQAASQLNCLEMASPKYIPEDGITIYYSDNTQGPLCAMCAPSGLAYRNYIYNDGQTENKQIDMSEKLLKYLKSKDPTNKNINWNVKNGYLMFNKQEELDTINKLLTDQTIFDEAKKLIQSGSHSKQGILFHDDKLNGKNKLINHVYCSGLPITYNSLNIDTESWGLFSKLFLEGMYENTLLIAIMNNLLLGEQKPCFLTKVGGGVFGMKNEDINFAIKKACKKIYNMGFNLEIFLIDLNKYDNDFEDFEKTWYPPK